MNIYKQICLLILVGFLSTGTAQVSQLDINRIEMMPNLPTPFNIRDWKQVAMQYDSFIYDIQKTGDYLPLVNLQTSGINYPENTAFGLHTYVGTNNPQGKEGINILPSLVGATLVGIDKTNQYDQNWVLMSQDFFNKDDEAIYLNHPAASSGNDWWYDMMPNIYFYQLNDLYPYLGGDETFQFSSIADKMQEAVMAMGGNDAPWQKAYMNYRAWNFASMEPNANGVKEPEAAGAFAWLLYHAWNETGNESYLKAAEWSMEFLNEWNSNPSYELQLPYGIYTAARMNAELNTDYDIEKMINWTFDRGPLRGWGAIVGNWNGFDVHGLIGEANDNGNDYAFQMNGTQQAGALVPLVRYDKRFARAIGKWVLNMSNATRLFYPGFLPDFLQDGSDWSNEYDPDRVIGYEALREIWEGNSPFSTGDATGGGWAATNLALYGSSSIGYLGSLINRTDDPRILQLDMLKTDFYKDQAYPTFLLFNPYNINKTVTINVGTEIVDVYEALSESFLLQSVSGEVALTIPADEAVVISFTPVGGVISYEKNRMLIDGVIVDYMQTVNPFTYAPRIQALAAANYALEVGDTTQVFGKAFDKDSDDLNYEWSTTGGTFHEDGNSRFWLAPQMVGDYEITWVVEDESGNLATKSIIINVVSEINAAPEIISLVSNSTFIEPNGVVTIEAIVTDENDDPLTYEWSANVGSISDGDNTVTWQAPDMETVGEITLAATDDEGLYSSASLEIWVHNFEATAGDIIAWYPFSQNGQDLSGNNLHGEVFGALYTQDFFNEPMSALLTDGINDKVTVDNDPILNFTDAITVSCWFSPKSLPDHEVFLLSHGSWQNRWKLSITPDKHLRWTVNTQNSIGDLDSEILLELDSIYHVITTYDGSWMTMYLNGELHSYRTLNGNIKTTTYPLLVGQMLPDNTEYNYKGIIDEVKIFDYALTPDAATTLFQQTITSVPEQENLHIPLKIFPNPATEKLTVLLPGNVTDNYSIKILDVHGRTILKETSTSQNQYDLAIETWPPGMYYIIFKNGQRSFLTRFMKI
ncbi:MAG: T9SS C-terminal target domain-containing protein [Bacteroidetes bacterium]|nr:MAG: T9SS C-terminal target domain-containing protein [Bacteroidota bacterium]